MNQVEPADCQECDWISIEDVLQQQDVASASASPLRGDRTHLPAKGTQPSNSRSLGQRLSGLFRARAADA